MALPAVLRSLVFSKRQVSARDGRWFQCELCPHCSTQDKRLDGLVVTFTGIKESKLLEISLREILASVQDRLFAQTIELEVTTAQKKVLEKA